MPRLYVDLDGVLCDFDRGAEAVLGMPCQDFQQLHGEKLMWHWLAKADGFYEGLEWMPGGRELWDAVRVTRPRPVILTGLPLGIWAGPQKRAWCARELGLNVAVVTCLSREKHFFCSAGDILIDDREQARGEWERAGGIFILHRNTEETLAELARVRGEGSEALGPPPAAPESVGG